MTSGFVGGTLWSTRRARSLIVAVHIAAIGIVPAVAIFGTPGLPPRGDAAIKLALALAVLALQLRHSFAIARGARPRGIQWTLLALAVLVYLPILWFGWAWVPMQVCLIASIPIVLRGWPAAIAITAPVVATDVAVAMTNVAAQASVDMMIYQVWYWTIALALPAAALYASARLARLSDELQESRAALAAAAIGRERLRVSRDLHDLLGQSLSAVSLKGDLAIRLLRSNPAAARIEIESLTKLARDAHRGIRAVSRDEHTVSLHTETEGAAALLSAAGIDARIDIDLPNLVPPLERMLAWAVREGVANALRHSQARTCSITAGHHDRNVFLEIVNDGALAPTGEGSGLAGLAERAGALSGSASTWHTADGEFRLLVEVPEEVA